MVRQTAVAAAAVFAVIAASAVPVPDFAPPTLVFHLVGYFVVYLVVARTANDRFDSAYTLQAVAVAVFGLGVVVEVAQGILPYRTFDVVDIAVNGLGVGAGYVFAVVLRRDGSI